MRYRQLGSSGLTVSLLGLGGNNFGRRCDLDQTRAVVDAALELGVNVIDTADVYSRGGSEELLGKVLKGRRDQVVIATKWGSKMHDGPDEAEARGGRRYIRWAVEQSLRRLQTDYIDLYQHHQPDAKTPIEETVAALDELVAEGKVRYGGSSNYSGWQIAEAEWSARSGHRARMISAQNHYSLLERGVEREVLLACEHYGVGQLPFFPLAGGLLTGKYKRGQAAPKGARLAGRADWLSDLAYDRVEALEKYAAERGRSVLEVAIGTLAARPVVGSVIAGATRPEQVRANAAALDWEPGADDLAALDEIVPPGANTRS